MRTQQWETTLPSELSVQSQAGVGLPGGHLGKGRGPTPMEIVFPEPCHVSVLWGPCVSLLYAQNGLLAWVAVCVQCPQSAWTCWGGWQELSLSPVLGQ